MCGRFSFTDTPDSRWVRELLRRPRPAGPPAGRWSIAPTNPVLTIGADREGERCSEVLRWDLFGRRPPLINIRGETALERPAFRRLLDHAYGRVLGAADSFYEWLHAERPDQPKLPIRYTLDDGSVFAFAGVRSKAGCALFTTTANQLIAPVHDRMPVILDDPGEEAAWLNPTLAAPEAARLLDALPSARMSAHRASTQGNNVPADGPELWNPEPAVVVGQAFHWFDHDRALAEIARAQSRGDGRPAVEPSR